MHTNERTGSPTLTKIDGRYVCVDNLRFYCILGVVAVHSTRVLTFSIAEDSSVDLFRIGLLALLKFATIGFFIVSGFLLEKNLQTCDSIELMGKRVRKVLFPWSFWFVLTCLLVSMSDFSQHKRAFLPGFDLYTAIPQTAGHILTDSALWFVPNLLVSLVALLVFRRYLQSPLFGLALFGANLYYTISVYTGWTDPRHTRAFFAFVFYLWLGNYAARNLAGLNRLLNWIRFSYLGGLIGLFVVLSFAESRLLHYLHSVDQTNTLKPSNQVLSVLVVLCFFKVRRPLWPSFVDVPRTTFGIYLSHAILITAVTSPIYSLMKSGALAHYRSSILFGLLLWLATTAVVWTTGFMVARFMAGSPGLSWMVGAVRPASLPREQTELAFSEG